MRALVAGLTIHQPSPKALIMLYVYRNKKTGETKRFDEKQEDLDEQWELVLKFNDSQFKKVEQK